MNKAKIRLLIYGIIQVFGQSGTLALAHEETTRSILHAVIAICGVIVAFLDQSISKENNGK